MTTSLKDLQDQGASLVDDIDSLINDSGLMRLRLSQQRCKEAVDRLFEDEHARFNTSAYPSHGRFDIVIDCPQADDWSTGKYAVFSYVSPEPWDYVPDDDEDEDNIILHRAVYPTGYHGDWNYTPNNVEVGWMHEELGIPVPDRIGLYLQWYLEEWNLNKFPFTDPHNPSNPHPFNLP